MYVYIPPIIIMFLISLQHNQSCKRRLKCKLCLGSLRRWLFLVNDGAVILLRPVCAQKGLHLSGPIYPCIWNISLHDIKLRIQQLIISCDGHYSNHFVDDYSCSGALGPRCDVYAYVYKYVNIYNIYIYMYIYIQIHTYTYIFTSIYVYVYIIYEYIHKYTYMDIYLYIQMRCAQIRHRAVLR